MKKVILTLLLIIMPASALAWDGDVWEYGVLVKFGATFGKEE